MGGTPNQQTTTAQQQQGQTVSNPWGPAQPYLQQLLGMAGGQFGNANPTPQELAAFQQTGGIYGAGDPNAGTIGQNATQMLTGGPDLTGGVNAAYDQYAKQVMPWASGAMGDPNSNPALKQMLDTIRADTTNSTNANFAASGRDMSGANSMALGRGIAAGEAPTLLAAQTQGLNTAQNLYNAGNATQGLLSNLNTQKFANMAQGVGMDQAGLAASLWGPQGILANSAAMRNLPLTNIANLEGLINPIAGLGGQTSSSGSSTGLTNQMNQVPWWQQALGAGMAGAGTVAKFMV
jgi:hypothetical protein